MLMYLALSGAALFTLLALLHLAWAAADRVPAAVIPTKRDGSRLFEPKRSESAGVAVGMLVAGFIVLQRGGVGPSMLPHWVRVIGCGAIAFMMMLRAIGDRQYIGLFKRERNSLFGRYDTLVYTPVVLVLAVIAGIVSYRGI